MSWEDTQTYTGQATLGLGIDFLPRMVCKIESFDSENTVTPKQNLPCYRLHHRIVQSWVADERGNLPAQADNSQVGQTFDNFLMKIVVGGDPEKNEFYERAQKTAIVAHGNGTTDALNQATGKVSMRSAYFDGRTAFAIYDPPKDDGDRYAAIHYLKPEDVNDILSGQRRVRWPKDQTSTRGNRLQVQAGGQASFTKGAPAQGTTQPPAGFTASSEGPASAAAPSTTQGPNPAAADVAAFGSTAPDNGVATAQNGVPQAGGSAPISW